MLQRYLPNTVTQCFLIGLSALIFASSVKAAEKSLTVEVIVFENFATKNWLEEFWPNLQQQPHANRPAKSFRSFPSANNGLNSVVNRMQASKGYRILFHQTWTQAFSGSKNGPLTLIENSASSSTQFQGYLQFYKMRYPHVKMDMQFQRYIPRNIRDSFAIKQQMSEVELPSSWRFDWQATSKLEQGKLYYLDHPLLGVLIEVHK
ncbi:CsiV family protein [Thiomicrorhabdus heinhorstiae]|uniref:Peptidoglycan-binding protein CsiV n=1 Tax=Thiomicrorhabdus heinhorstiae TaxID=2748010 RepID=A0ABS0BUD3_9GAMM|nr:CsiV family protein [Thiomicrorhabdus heinhorstiae]MBF6056934.1 hypothetical protein [Thiomicrorhabdus heinhorstiae]